MFQLRQARKPFFLPQALAELDELFGADLLGKRVADASGVGQKLAAVQGENGIEPGDPIAHGHGNLLLRLGFGKREILFDQKPQRLHFGFGKIIFGCDSVLLGDPPLVLLVVGLHPHKRQNGVGASRHKLRRRLLADRPKQLVLDNLEKPQRLFR